MTGAEQMWCLGQICFGVLKLQQLDGHVCVFFIAWSQGLGLNILIICGCLLGLQVCTIDFCVIPSD